MEPQEALIARLERIERLLRDLHKKDKKPRWAKVGDIADITGWSKERMRRARETGQVRWKKDGNGYWYDVNSIHPAFLKTAKQTA